jgi:hypothetical protein
LGEIKNMAGEWKPWYISDTGDSDTSKDFVAPGELQLLSVRVYLTSNADAGNRVVSVAVYDDSDGTNIISQALSGTVQAASTDWYHDFFPGAARLTSVYNTNYVSSPIPTWILQRGQMIRVSESAGIAADTDDMEVFITGMVKGSMWGDTQVLKDWPS